MLRVWVDDRVRGLFGLGKVLGFFFSFLFFFFCLGDCDRDLFGWVTVISFFLDG